MEKFIMKTEDKLRMIEEIKRLETELYLKRSKLASIEAMESELSPVGEGLKAGDWKKVFSELINLIGAHSTGGDSVEDTRKEREK
ncbi:MAG: hypothetical protein ACK44H_07805 [Candidatus Kryptonium sp.]